MYYIYVYVSLIIIHNILSLYDQHFLNNYLTNYSVNTLEQSFFSGKSV